MANVRWLAGYRHPRHALAEVADALLDAFREPAPLLVGARRIGDPIAVLPVLFHLLWTHRLVIDLSVTMDARSTVVTPG